MLARKRNGPRRFPLTGSCAFEQQRIRFQNIVSWPTTNAVIFAIKLAFTDTLHAKMSFAKNSGEKVKIVNLSVH
jgi:hypothetical protein